MSSAGASDYGDRHAAVYDRLYGGRFASAAAVAALAAAAGDHGAVLELGLGTGRLAIPLAQRGLLVDGIEGSPAMVDRLRQRPGGDRVGVFVADLAEFDLPRRDYAVAVCAVSTLFMLGHDQQRSCVRAAARHLRPGGQLFIEAFRPDPDRFDTTRMRVETRPDPDGPHVVRSRHDPHRRAITITHELRHDRDHHGNPGDVSRYEVTLHYADVQTLDATATAAGLQLTTRWHDWTGAPARPDSTDPISVYTAPV